MATMNASFVATSTPVPNVQEPRQLSQHLMRLRVPVEVSFKDQSGRSFVDNAKTELISAWGATLEFSYSVSWGQELLLSFGNKEILARIVGQIGVGHRSHSYGVCFLQEDQQFWGVSFPKLATVRDDARVLECCRCGHTRVSAINDIEALVLVVNRALRLRCPVCNDTGYWRAAEPAQDLEQSLDIQHFTQHQQTRSKRSGHESSETDPDLVPMGSIYDAELFRPAPRAERRRHKRVNLSKAKGCIERPGTEPDIVEVVNVSRSGACVRSSTFYPIGSWIRVACPYTIGGSNIFQSARVIRISSFAAIREYGLEYLRLV